MDETLRALGLLLLRAIPTFLLLVVLHFYLKYVYFRPMQRVLKARYEATEGARRLAEESVAQASQKTAEYEAALQAARGEIYRDQEEFRQRLRQEHAQALRQAREEAGFMVKQAKEQLAADVASAKNSLRQQTESLADEIVRTILRRRVA